MTESLPENSTPPKAHAGVDLKKIALGDLFHAGSRLSLGSALFLVAGASGLFGTGVAVASRSNDVMRDTVTVTASDTARVVALMDSLRTLESLRVSDAALRAALLDSVSGLERDALESDSAGDLAEAFEANFSLRFASEDVLEPLVRGIIEDSPEGLGTPADVRASLLWQVRTFKGFAEFLSGDRSSQLQVTFDEESVNFEWNERSNIVRRIFADVGIPARAADVRRVSADLNRSGVAVLNSDNYVVRGVDGGLSVISN